MTRTDKVSINAVKAAYQKTGKHSFKKLLDEGQKFESKYVERAEYEKAAKVNECKCGRVILEHSKMCQECFNIQKAKMKKKALRDNWVALHEQLKQFDSAYLLGEHENTVKLEKDEHTITIYRDSIYSSDRWSTLTGYALRITTDDWDVKANRLRKDFGADGLAEHLHTKVSTLLNELKAKDAREDERKNKSKILARKIIDSFPSEIGRIKIESHIGRNHRGGYIGMSAKRVNFMVGEDKFNRYLTAMTYNGETYTINGLEVILTAEEVLSILNITKTAKRR